VQPLLLVFENLHWIDAETQAFLDGLVESLPAARLLLLVNYRPEYAHGWGSKTYYTQLRLDPLLPASTAAMLRSLLGDDAELEPLKGRLIERTQGNPFFLEESVRTLVETQVLIGAPGAYRLAQALPTIQVPAPVQAVLAARIDRLPPEEKQLLQTAAVIGTGVPLALLQAVAEAPEERLRLGLTHLQAAEFLYETRLFPELEYTFKHVLTQEVAYQSLVRHARQQSHARIAQVLEAQFPERAETQPELLAQHYTEANSPEQALPYWQRAGQRAIERSANVEAISHLMKGLEMLKILPDTPARTQQELELQLALGSVLRMVKGHIAPDVEHTYTRAYELSQQIGDSPQRLAALVSLWRFYLNQGKLQTAQVLAEQGLTSAQQVQDSRLLQDAHRMVGGTALFQGEPATAWAHVEQGIVLYDAQHSRQPSFSGGMDRGVTCRSYAAWPLWLLGYPEQALTMIREALTLASELSHAFSLAFALNYASMLHGWRREVQSAKERAEAVMTLATEHGFINALTVGMIRRGWALAMQGAVAEGIRQLHHGLAAFRDMEQVLPLAHHLALLAEAYQQGGQVEAALQALAEAFAHVDNTGERYYEAELYRLKGECLLAQTGKRCKAREAEECFRQALAIARRQQAKSWELRATMSLSHLWQQQGKRIEAYELLAPIYDWFTEGFDTADLQEAKALLETLA
jgi:predicted ATPase